MLEVSQQAGSAADASGTGTAVEAERCERARRLADIPFDWVQSVAAVGDVGDPETLAGGQQVVQALGNQGAERNLERVGRDVEVAPAGGSRVQVDPLATDPDGVRERLRPIDAGSGLNADVGFQHR